MYRLLLTLSALTFFARPALAVDSWKYDFPSAPPYSNFVEMPDSGLTAPFCWEWNPDFPYRGGACCAKPLRRGSNYGGFCPAARAKSAFCDEMTLDQIQYIKQVETGKIPDVLKAIEKDQSRKWPQAFCSVNNGFLAWGRPLIASDKNRILLKTPGRCTDFGTDPMIGMLEWLGRQVAQRYSAPEYSGVRLVIGDISAPRGGCLKGQGGHRGHSSHMAGQDVDVGYLTAKPGVKSPVLFHKNFDGSTNWWLIKELFKNPYACVKVIFLDRSNIRKLQKAAQGDPEWDELRIRIRHVRNHKNHMHVRIGNGPGAPGCVGTGGDADDEENEEG